jgi:hypothetical protein
MAQVNLLSAFDVEQIALVTKGANRKRYFLRKSGEPSVDLVESPAEHELIAKADWSRVYCVVAEPGWQESPGQLAGDQSIPDEWASEEEIAKAQRSFVKNGSRINKMHDALIPYGEVIDNAIALADFKVTDPEGEEHLIRKGSWYISIEPTDEGRELIDKGDFTGISVEGTANRTTVEKSQDELERDVLIEIAKADLGGADRLDDGDVELLVEIEKSYREAVAKAGSSAALPDLDWSKGQNWIDKLPKAVGRRFKKSWIYRTAKHLVYDEGMTRSRAFAVAINAAKRGCATGDLNFKGKQSVNAKSRAEMCAAVAAWDAAKAANKTKAVAKASGRGGTVAPMSLIRKMAEKVGMKPEEIDEALAAEDREEVEKSASFADRLAADKLNKELPEGLDLLRSCIYRAVDGCHEDEGDPMPQIRASLDEFADWAGGLLGSSEAVKKQAEALPEGWNESSVRPDTDHFDSMDEAETKSLVEEQIAKAVPAAIEEALKPVTESIEKLTATAAAGKSGEGDDDGVAVAKADVDSIAKRLDEAVESINEEIAKIGEDLEELATGESEQNNGGTPDRVEKSSVQSLAEEIL